MSKFKVGDWVVPNDKWLIKELVSYNLIRTEIYKVKVVFEDTKYPAIQLEGFNNRFDQDYFDLIGDNPSTTEEKSSPNALDKQVSGNHYKDCKIQPVEYIQANGLSYLEGNVIKYTTRHSKKNGKADIEKAIHYLELILEMEYKDK